ncbi:MAG TPA: c-type cytochrome domain-containing protein [Acidobacteriota bacterium]
MKNLPWWRQSCPFLLVWILAACTPRPAQVPSPASKAPASSTSTQAATAEMDSKARSETGGSRPDTRNLTPDTRSPQPVSFRQVHALFRQKCLSCHSTQKTEGSLLLESYDTLMEGGEHGAVVVPGKSNSSRIILMLEGKITPRMPAKGTPLEEAEIDLMRKWIDAGAPGPAPNETAEASDKPIVPDIKPMVPILGPAAAVAFGPQGSRVAVGSYQAVYLLDAAQGKWTTTLEGPADLTRAVCFSPDGKWLAAAGGASVRFGEIKLWDTGAGSLVRAFRGHTDSIYSISFSPDSKLLASSSYDRLIKLWDVSSGREIRTLKEHVDAVYAIAFTPDGKHLISAAGDRTVKIWEVESGRRVATLSESQDALYALAVHPSGKLIAAAGADKIIRVWNWTETNVTSSGQATFLARSAFAHGESVLRLAYSADGKTLVSTGADRLIKLWDAETLREKQALEIQPDWVMSLALSPDGRWLAAGRYDGSLGIYDLFGEKMTRNFTVPNQAGRIASTR